jgi:hypothetical protein
LPGWTFWVLALVCVFVSSYRVWQKEYLRAEGLAEKLEGAPVASFPTALPDPLSDAREASARADVGKMDEAEQQVLGELLARGSMDDGRISAFCRERGLPDMGGSHLERKSHFMARDPVTGGWCVRPDAVKLVHRIVRELGPGDD